MARRLLPCLGARAMEAVMDNTGLSDLVTIAIVGVFVLSILDALLKPSRRRSGCQPRPVRKPQLVRKPHFDREPQFARRRFLSPRELRVLPMLEAALPRHRIMAQVAMGALLQAAETSSWQAKFTRYRFAQKIVDFVIVSRETGEVLALVELDDHTHDFFKDRQRDAMTAAAGYRTIRIPGRPHPTFASVRDAVAEFSAAAAERLYECRTECVSALPSSDRRTAERTGRP